jgi:predicted DNA-binding antitoxin AbrB/MazE fold protein
MSERIDAIYEGGVLRPLKPLSLPDHARVKLTIDAQPPSGAAITPQDEWEQHLLALAKDCGVSLPDAALTSEEYYD